MIDQDTTCQQVRSDGALELQAGATRTSFKAAIRNDLPVEVRFGAVPGSPMILASGRRGSQARAKGPLGVGATSQGARPSGTFDPGSAGPAHLDGRAKRCGPSPRLRAGRLHEPGWAPEGPGPDLRHVSVQLPRPGLEPIELVQVPKAVTALPRAGGDDRILLDALRGWLGGLPSRERQGFEAGRPFLRSQKADAFAAGCTSRLPACPTNLSSNGRSVPPTPGGIAVESRAGPVGSSRVRPAEARASMVP